MYPSRTHPKRGVPLESREVWPARAARRHTVRYLAEYGHGIREVTDVIAEAARWKIVDCERKPAQHRAALEAGHGSGRG